MAGKSSKSRLPDKSKSVAPDDLRPDGFEGFRAGTADGFGRWSPCGTKSTTVK